MHKSVKSLTKRLIDIGGSLLGLIILGVIFIPVSILIKLDSKGPIIYTQTRVGLNGKRFKIYKFRTMVEEAEKFHPKDSIIYKNENDWRITKVGRYLRKYSIDEFPQFWNVLIGEMSMVGTRPPTVNEVDNYDKYHFKRLEVKPGITGVWQTSGRSTIKNFQEILKMDLSYQKEWSILLDLSLIFKTIGVVLSSEGSF